jgi:hypothetical protein
LKLLKRFVGIDYDFDDADIVACYFKGMPVVHPIAARSWDIQRRLTVRQPRPGFGRLLAEMPLD